MVLAFFVFCKITLDSAKVLPATERCFLWCVFLKHFQQAFFGTRVFTFLFTTRVAVQSAVPNCRLCGIQRKLLDRLISTTFTCFGFGLQCIDLHVEFRRERRDCCLICFKVGQFKGLLFNGLVLNEFSNPKIPTYSFQLLSFFLLLQVPQHVQYNPHACTQFVLWELVCRHSP